MQLWISEMCRRQCLLFAKLIYIYGESLKWYYLLTVTSIFGLGQGGPAMNMTGKEFTCIAGTDPYRAKCPDQITLTMSGVG